MISHGVMVFATVRRWSPRDFELVCVQIDLIFDILLVEA